VSVHTACSHTELLLNSEAHRAVEMWKANNAYHIFTAPTTTAARYTRPQTQTEKLRLRLADKNGAGRSGS